MLSVFSLCREKVFKFQVETPAVPFSVVHMCVPALAPWCPESQFWENSHQCGHGQCSPCPVFLPTMKDFPCP